ncbi:MAG: hypothetical protein HKO68_07220 [Desulfobacterales bacterium]|nr:hypothetical protein [Desulfobacterales bacterium]
MYKNILICAVFVVLALCVNVALSDMDYPEGLNQVSAPYPGGTIFSVTNASSMLMVSMHTSDSPDTILDFYKNQLEANGWTIMHETQSQGHAGLICEKGSNGAVVNIGAGQSGKSVIGLVLSPK